MAKSFALLGEGSDKWTPRVVPQGQDLIPACVMPDSPDLRALMLATSPLRTVLLVQCSTASPESYSRSGFQLIATVNGRRQGGSCLKMFENTLRPQARITL